MALNNEQVEFLEFAFPIIEEQMEALSDWEQGFMEDQIKRYAKYQADTSFSAKQWSVIERVWAKLDIEAPVGISRR